MIGDESGSATDISRLFVSSGLSPPIGNDGFWSYDIIQILGQKCRKKMVISSFLGYLGEIV